MHKFLILFAALLGAGCSSNFNETHYFKSSDPVTGEPVNYFRITVEGRNKLARSRYVSGYYDERAVELFFNELKTDTGATAGDIKTIFNATTEPGTDLTIKPLSPGSDHGAFIMFFSTNAKAVSDAIGAFADNQAVADALTNILNRGTVRDQRQAAAVQAEETKRNAATLAELETLFVEVDANGPVEKEPTKETLLRILGVIARSLGADTQFSDFKSGVDWANAQPLNGETTR